VLVGASTGGPPALASCSAACPYPGGRSSSCSTWPTATSGGSRGGSTPPARCRCRSRSTVIG
jgi:hypothetical protein